MKQRLPMLAVGLAFVLCAVTAEAQVAFQLFADNPDGLCNGASASWQNGVGEAGGQGLVLTKPCTTPTNADAGAFLQSPLIGGSSGALTELNFDISNASQCGAGSPRFNVVVDGNFYFLGCSHGTVTDLGNGFSHVQFTAPFSAFTPSNGTTPTTIPTNGTLEQVYLIVDDGNDEGMGSGTYTLDKISVNAAIIDNGTPFVEGVKTVIGGNLQQGGTVIYQVVLENTGAGPQPDNAGDEFTDTLPSQLTLTSSSTSSGVVSDVGNTVHFNGAIAAGASVTITIHASISANASGSIDNSGTTHFDGSGSGVNDSSLATFNSSAAAANFGGTCSALPCGEPAATTFALVAAPVPALSSWALALMAALLAITAAFAILRR